ASAQKTPPLSSMECLIGSTKTVALPGRKRLPGVAKPNQNHPPRIRPHLRTESLFPERFAW
ncbi:MAG: hypothetical protein ACKO0N_16135, partial [Planctomycetota bacterium]